MSQTNETLTQKIARLDELVAWFDSEEFSIETAMEKFKQAETLAEDIKKDLAEFQAEITVLKQKFDQ